MATSRQLATPKMFWPTFSDGPFDRCVECGDELREAGKLHVVEKAIRGEETIFEFALCVDCCGQLHRELSPESNRRVDEFFAERIDFRQRRESFEIGEQDAWEPWINRCLLTEQRREDCGEHQVFALCRGGDIIVSLFPYMLSGEAVEQVAELMSRQTRDRLDDFVRDRLGLPPEFCGLPMDTLPLMI